MDSVDIYVNGCNQAKTNAETWKPDKDIYINISASTTSKVLSDSNQFYQKHLLNQLQSISNNFTKNGTSLFLLHARIMKIILFKYNMNKNQNIIRGGLLLNRQRGIGVKEIKRKIIEMMGKNKCLKDTWLRL